MKKGFLFFLCGILVTIGLVGCGESKPPQIGVAFGVGPASRWVKELAFMEEYANELGVELVSRLNRDETAKPFVEDCTELIDSGIDTLIVRPRDVSNMKEVVDYAHRRKVKVISYDSLIEDAKVDLFVGYDSEHAGQRLGRYLTELAAKGDYILLWGDMNRNVKGMYDGAMKYIEPMEGSVNIILETGVPGWSSEEAKRLVKEAVSQNDNNVDAIMAFNDTLAGAAAEAIEELGIEKQVFITGMDAELDALKRIVNGTQSCTLYMNLKELSCAAVDQAVQLAKGKGPETNYEIANDAGEHVPSYLLARSMVTAENMDRVLVEPGYFTAQEIYGTMITEPAATPGPTEKSTS